MSSSIIYYSVVPSSISIIGCSLFLYHFFRYKGIRLKPSMRLIAVLQSIDLLVSTNTILPTYLFPQNLTLCKIQGFNEQLFTTSEILWLGWFSLFVYRAICLKQDKNECVSIPKAFTITLSVTLPISILFAVLNLYTHAGYRCWIDSEGNVVKFVVFEILCTYFMGFLMFGWTVFVMWSVLKNHRIKIIDKNIFRLMIYPFILFLCYFFMFTVRVMEYLGVDVANGYQGFANIVLNLVGFVNFVVLGANEEFKSGIRFVRGENILEEISFIEK